MFVELLLQPISTRYFHFLFYEGPIMRRLFPIVGLIVALTISAASNMNAWGQKQAEPKAKAEPKTKAAEPKAKAKAAAADDAPKSAKTEKEAAPRRRLPQYYSKVGIEERQREAIYKIQADYEGKLDKLEAELKALRDKRDDEILGVLTRAQQKKLEELIEEAKKGRADPAAVKETATEKAAAK